MEFHVCLRSVASQGFPSLFLYGGCRQYRFHAHQVSSKDLIISGIKEGPSILRKAQVRSCTETSVGPSRRRYHHLQ